MAKHIPDKEDFNVSTGKKTSVLWTYRKTEWVRGKKKWEILQLVTKEQEEDQRKVL